MKRWRAWALSLVLALVASCGIHGVNGNEINIRPHFIKLDVGGTIPACKQFPKTDCYTASGMKAWLVRTGGGIWREFFGGLAPRIVYMESSEREVYSSCERTNSIKLKKGDGKALFYCEPDDAIYVGQSALWDSYSKGDLLPVIRLLKLFLQSADPKRPARNDCKTGAFTRTLVRSRGGATAQPDQRAIGAYYELLDPQHQGAPKEWRDFQLGLDGGVKACAAVG